MPVVFLCVGFFFLFLWRVLAKEKKKKKKIIYFIQKGLILLSNAVNGHSAQVHVTESYMSGTEVI